MSNAAESEADSTVSSLRNFRLLVFYQVLLRTGWIFKTESIIMPAVLDTLSGAGWVRGFLPVLNRFGYSVPPLLVARRLKQMPRKKWSLFASTVYMAGSFLGMAGLFWLDRALFARWLPLLFLILYAVFFMAIGVNQLAFNTLQGKLVPTTRRGKLLWVSNAIGAVTAIACAFWFLPAWLDATRPRFDMIFGFSGVLFAISSATCLLLREARDDLQEPSAPWHRGVRDAARLLQEDRVFRQLAWIGAMYGSSIMLFPHYQNLGLQGMKLDLSSLMGWVVVQNLGTGLFSIPAGAMADRFGNRLVLRLGLAVIMAAPLTAMMAVFRPTEATIWFYLVFACVGVTPVVLRTFQNFALELSPAAEHPRYLSTISLVIAAPIVLSPLAGTLLDCVGHSVVFAIVAMVVGCGGLATFRLPEPRGKSRAHAA